MTRWLMHPQRMRPGTGMPEQGPSEAEARAIAAYLYTLD
ncbi:c-type cytochrome [Sphingomonas sp. Xoc002]